MKIRTLSIALLIVLSFVTYSGAQMMGGGGTTGGGTTGGGMMGSGNMMTTTGGFGMMNGMAGAPIIGSDGTAYMTSMIPSAIPGFMPTSNSFSSHLVAVTTSGQTTTMSVSGLMSRPVISGGTLISTASLPKMTDYTIMANDGTTTQQSVLFFVQLPMTSSSVPTAVSMDGSYASEPVLANNMIYVTTTNSGRSMLQGNNVFFNAPRNTIGAAATSYLYIFNMDGTLVSKTTLQ